MKRRQVIGTIPALGLGLAGTTAVGAGSRSAGGEVLWSFETGDRVYSSPTVVDGTVYVGSYDDRVYALDAGTGVEIWSHGTGDSVFSSPTVVDGTAYVGSLDGTVYAFDADTGVQVWTYETGDFVHSSPTVVDGTVYVGSDDATMYAIDAETREEEWTVDVANEVYASPTVVDGTVYVACARSMADQRDTSLYALDAETGFERWSVETEVGIRSSPTVVDGIVYVGTADWGGSDAYGLHAFDATTGEEEWSFRTGGELADMVVSSPTVADGTVYVGGDAIYAFDADGGDPAWRVDVGDRVGSSPTVADGVVYVGARDSNLYAIDADTGEQRWSFRTGDRVFSSPTVVDGTVYVGSHDATVYALDAGVDGSSAGSRIRLGTLGHHEEWAERAAPAPEPATFEVVDLAPAEATVTRGDPLDVSATIENTGDATGTKVVSYRVSGDVIAERELELGAGESASVTFDGVDTSGFGEQELHGVFTEDDSTTALVTVEEPDPDDTPDDSPDETDADPSDWTDDDPGEEMDADPTDDAGATRGVPADEQPERIPGFGVLEAVAGVGGLGYLLSRRFGADERE